MKSSDLLASGILDKLVNGPWMHLLYKDHSNSLHTAKENFVPPIKKGDVWASLIESTNALVSGKVSRMASTIKMIIKHQIAWYS